MKIRAFITAAGVAIGLGVVLTGWIAFPTESDLEIPAPLVAWTSNPVPAATSYIEDLAPLISSFRAQRYRSFCGPASLETVLRAYGVKQADQTELFPSFGTKLGAFYTGVTLPELSELARHAGLHSEVVFADTLALDEFREKLKANLSNEGDFILVNYDRRVLKQAGGGHISPVAAYDESRDTFLVLDEASFKYPFTWIPAPLLYEAIRTRDGDHFRGLLLIQSYSPVS